MAIETGLALRLVFHQPLLQTEGLLRSIADVPGISIAIPDHTTPGRRGGGLTILLKDIDRTEPLHLLVDSTGLKIYGEGEWLDQKHGIRSHRSTYRDDRQTWTPRHGRMDWQRRSGYNRRSLIETAMFRYKTIIGRRLHHGICPISKPRPRSDATCSTG